MKLFVDTETSGLPGNSRSNKFPEPFDLKKYDCSRMVQIGIIVTDEKLNIIHKYSSIVKPNNFIIPEVVIKIHGIDNIRANQEGKEISEIWKEILPLISECKEFIAHNVMFDYNIIMSELLRDNQYEFISLLSSMKRTCTKVMGKGKSLSKLYESLFSESWIQKHDALDDCEACYECYKKLIVLN